MCGKFTQMLTWSELHEISDLLGQPSESGGHDRQGSNDTELTVTPMRDGRIIRLGAGGPREVVAMRWGWPDRRPNALLSVPKHMHARGESIDTTRLFAPSFATRRGIAVVRTFNEGEEVGKKTVQHVLTPRDRRPLGIAVVYDTVPTAGGATVEAFVMVTTAACPPIDTITDRMPAILRPEHWPIWLGETAAPLQEIKSVLTPYNGGLDMALQPKPPPKSRT